MRATRLAGALLIVLAGCTGGGDDTTSVAPSIATVYYYDGDVLVPVQRELRPGEDLDGLAQSLLAPAPGKLASALSRVSFDGVTVDGDSISVEVGTGFAVGSDDEVARRAAQAVYGLTAATPEATVSFTIEGDPLEVVTGNGTATDEPVARDDYARFRPWLEIVQPAPGDALATHSIRIELALRQEVDVRVRFEASDQKYYDVIRSGAGIVSVPLDVILVGGGTMTVTALQNGVERSLEIPVTFNPPH